MALVVSYLSKKLYWYDIDANLSFILDTAVPSFFESYDRIVGGQTAPKMIPWQVSLRYCGHGQCHYCGGTILDSKTILTAAHCEPIAGDEFVMAGKTNVKKGKNIKINKVIYPDE